MKILKRIFKFIAIISSHVLSGFSINEIKLMEYMSVRRIIVTTCENADFLFILLERTVISNFTLSPPFYSLFSHNPHCKRMFFHIFRTFHPNLDF